MALRGIFWIQFPWRNPSVRCSDPQELLHSFLPLVAAVNARAIPFNGPILPAGNPTCAAMDSRAGVSCVSGASNSSPAGQSGVEGVALGTSSMIAFLNGGIATLTVSASGPLVNAGIPTGTTIPLNYVFSLSFQNGGTGATVTGWSLDFDLLDGSSIIGNSGAIDGVLTETATLSVTWNRADLGELVVNVPQKTSFDYRSTSGVPEPGTMGLTGSVFTFGAWYLWRRKKGLAPIRSGR